jgi:septum site-determining protein MinC
MKEPVVIKGTSDGLVITLGEGPLDAVLTEMENRLSARASFFRGGRVSLNAGDRPISAEQLREIGATLERLGVTLWAVNSDHPVTHLAAREVGLEVATATMASAPASKPVPGPSPYPMAAEGAIAREEMAGMVVRRTLRSGQAVHYPGHVTVIGDVNSGAEVVAGGDIIIWGRLRGIAHAGAMGDEQAIVCALEMMPSQIRIGGHIARQPAPAWRPKAPEKASVQDGRIVVEKWKK